MRKCVGGDEDSLMGKAKSRHASKAKERIHLPLAMGRDMLSRPQESWGSVTQGGEVSRETLSL